MGPHWLLIFVPLGASTFAAAPVYGGHVDRVEVCLVGQRAVEIAVVGMRATEATTVGVREIGMVPHADA